MHNFKFMHTAINILIVFFIFSIVGVESESSGDLGSGDLREFSDDEDDKGPVLNDEDEMVDDDEDEGDDEVDDEGYVS